MRDLRSLSSLAPILWSGTPGVGLILAGLGAVSILPGFALQANPAPAREAWWILGPGLVSMLLGLGLIGIPTLKLWPGLAVKIRDEAIA